MENKQPTWAEEVENETAIRNQQIQLAERQSELHAAILEQQKILEKNIEDLQRRTREVAAEQDRTRQQERLRKETEDMALESLSEHHKQMYRGRGCCKPRTTSKNPRGTRFRV